MKEYSISVIVATYNPEPQNLLATIKSIVCQKNVDFELVVTDDGSVNDCFDVVEEYLNECYFSNYKLLKNPQNIGTVLNIYGAVIACSGKFIKGLSPGDFLYDDFTLRKIVDYMDTKKVDFCFGDAVYYRIGADGNVEYVRSNNRPNRTDCYAQLTYNYKKVINRVLFDGDVVLGAEIAYSRDSFRNYLSMFAGKVRYAEDYLVYFYVLDNKKLGYLNEYMIFYEFGSGMSIRTENKWIIALKADLAQTFSILKERYSDNKKIEKAEKYINANYIDNYIVRNATRCLIHPGSALERLGNRKYRYSNEAPINDSMLKNVLSNLERN